MVTLPRKARPEMTVRVVYDGPIPAPIRQGAELAKLVVGAPGMKDVEVPLYAGAAVGRLGPAGRVVATLRHLLWGSLQ